MFHTASRIQPAGSGRYTAHADATWLQGRGQFGGLVAAWLVRAFQHRAPDRPLRTLTLHLAAPVPPGEVQIEVEDVRAGAHVTQVAGRVVAGDRVLVTALGTLAGRRGDDVTLEEGAAPPVPPPTRLERMPPQPGLPTFTQHVAYQPALGAPVGSGASRGELGGWCRFLGPTPADRAMVAGLLDAWPPTVFAVLRGLRPAATVDMTLHFLADPAPDAPPEVPWLFRGLCTWAAEGYAEEVGELRDAEGRLLARARQWIALLPAGRT